MRRIVVGFMSTVSALVLLFSYHTSLGASTSTANGDTDAGTDATAGSGTDESTSGGTASGSRGDPGSTSSGSSPSSGASTSGTFTGEAADTRWGPVQVRVTVAGGRITKSEAVVYPDGNPRDQQINAYAVPALNEAAVEAQSSQIDALSGATVTSDGYIQSLQSAIDQANL